MMDELESWLDQHGYELISHTQRPNTSELVIACGTSPRRAPQETTAS